MLVVDASVLVTALAHDGAAGDRARGRLRGQQLVAPELVDLECVSVFRRLALAGTLAGARATVAVRDLAGCPVERVPHLSLMPRVWSLRKNLTPYDAAYVALAESMDAILLTADQRLARAPGTTCETEVFR